MRRIDDCLSTHDGRLFVEQCDTLDLVRRFGSPLFVVSEDQLRRNVRRFRKAFQRGWTAGPVALLPAAKASWSRAVQRILVAEGCGADVYSPGELSAALDAGCDPALVSVNGVPKDEGHIHRAVEVGARITIDSVEEIDLIEKSANALGRTARVRLRLKPTLSGFTDHSEFAAEGLVPTDIAALAYKGGLMFEQIAAIAPRLRQMKSVKLVGFHQHHGRHAPTTRYWREQMRSLASEVARVCALFGGFRPGEIDIGGGFAIHRDPFNKATHYGEPAQLAALYAASRALEIAGPRTRYRAISKLIDTLVNHPNAERAPTIEQYAEVTTRTLDEELVRHGVEPRGVLLQLEPGRSLHGDTGIHLTTVRNIKRMTQPIRWNHVIVDTTEFWFTGGRYEHHLHDYVFANKPDAPMVDRADIIGRSCYGDRLIPIVPVPDVEVGDVLAILDTGAYQEVSMSNFNAMPRPATVLVTGDSAEIIRRAETAEDVFRRDVVPAHLGRPHLGRPS